MSMSPLRFPILGSANFPSFPKTRKYGSLPFLYLIDSHRRICVGNSMRSAKHRFGFAVALIGSRRCAHTAIVGFAVVCSRIGLRRRYNRLPPPNLRWHFDHKC